MGDMSAEGLPKDVSQQDVPAPVNTPPGKDFFAKTATPARGSGLGLKVAGVVAGLATLFGADRAANTHVVDAAAQGVGEVKTALKNVVVGEANPVIILRDHALYDLAVRPFQQPGHPKEEATFYRSPYAQENEALSKEELTELGVKFDVQGNVFAQRGRKVEGRPLSQFPGPNETQIVNGEEKRVGRWAEVQLPNGRSVFVPDQFVEYGNPAPNVAQPHQ